MSKSRVFLYVCLAFISGVSIASFFIIPVIILFCFFVFGGILMVFGLSARSWTVRGQGVNLAIVGVIILFFLAGAMRFSQKSDRAPRTLDDVLRRSVEIRGRITQEPAQKEKSQEIIIEEGKTGNKVLVRTEKYPPYFYGQDIRAAGLFEEPENFTADFDYISYLARDDIFYVMNFPTVEISGASKKDLRYYLFSIKSAFSKQINAILPEPHASFLSGLILGERRSIPKELTEKFQITGTSHLVALSGFNITIVADGISKFFSALSVPFRASFWLASIGIGLFTILTGASPSVVRASVMGVLVLIARKEGRLYSIRNALVFAGAVMVFHNPKILRFDVAFLATLGLVYASPVFDEYFEKIKARIAWKVKPRFPEEMGERSRSSEIGTAHPRKKSFLREVFISTLSAQFMVLPILVYNFGSVSLISPVTNVMILAAIPSTMFFGFITGIAGFIFLPFAKILSWISWLFLQYEISVIEFFAGIPLASVAVAKLPFSLVILSYAVVWYWLWNKNKSTEKRAG